VERYEKLGEVVCNSGHSTHSNEGATLKIVVVVYWVSYSKHRLQLGLSDWSDVEFRYDCDKQQVVVSSVKLGGV
jgi:hypothetical protein